MKEYLISLVTPLLKNPEVLEVVSTKDDQGFFLTLHVSKPDMGRVLGKNGETVKAIRTLLFAAGGLNQQSVRLKVSEPNEYAR